MRKIMLKKVSFMVDFVNFKRYNKQTFGKRWDGSVLNIVLVEPEIPQNCGNIARTCAATGSRLHLVKPLGFDISDRAVKRAGLDYWHLVEVSTYENLADLFEQHPEAAADCWLATTKALSTSDGGILSFSKGLPTVSDRNRADRGCVSTPDRGSVPHRWYRHR